MPTWLTEAEYAVLTAACDRTVPATADGPGAVAAGAPDYIDGLLGAFLVDPPRIWACGPTSGRFSGESGAGFHALSPLDELAWRIRIEGSQGRPEREFNGPVVGLQERYRSALGALGRVSAQWVLTSRTPGWRPSTDSASSSSITAARGCTAPPSTGATGMPSRACHHRHLRCGVILSICSASIAPPTYCWHLLSPDGPIRAAPPPARWRCRAAL